MLKKNIFSILTALVILYLSLASSQSFDKVPYFNIPYFDKIVHFGMYFGLMSVIIFENRKSIKSSRQLFLIAIIPFLYGVSMEILQLTLTLSRSGSIYDAVADLAGIITSLLLWLWVKPFIKQEIK